MNFRLKTQLYDMLLPATVLLILMFIFHQTTLDIYLASHFYNLNSSWIYRDNYFLETVLHKGGVKFTLIIFIVMIGYLYYSQKSELNKKKHDFLKFVLLSSLLTIILVYVLKSFTTLSCPWNNINFGGTSRSIPLWLFLSSDFPKAHCFPAGHSSAGYAFLSLYYGHSFIYGKRNFYFLIPGVLIGSIFGIAQQIRGAHFMSHDLATILISIFSAWVTNSMINIYNNLYEN